MKAEAPQLRKNAYLHIYMYTLYYFKILGSSCEPLSSGYGL